MGRANEAEILEAGLGDVGVDAAEIDDVLRRIESRHPVAAVADGEIGENVRALTAEQKLRAKTADKIRFTRAGAQMRRSNAVAQIVMGPDPLAAGPP